jgi:hypothetical protein
MNGTRLLVGVVLLTVAGAVVALAGSASTVLGLLALAGAGALLATSGWGRRAVAVVVLLAGIATAFDGQDAAGIVAAVLEGLAALIVLARSGALPALGGRYEAPAEQRTRIGAHGLWDALDRGEDPT